MLCPMESTLISKTTSPPSRKFCAASRSKVKQAQNQLVVITTQGGAQPVAVAIDHEGWPESVGTIAGDDTVLIICPDNKHASKLFARIEEMIGQ